MRAAEAALVAHGGKVADLTVANLKALVLSRTGKNPKAKNNKDGALLAEAEAAARAQTATLLPETLAPAPPPPPGDGGGDEAVSDGAEPPPPTWACESCGIEFGAADLPEPDENEHLWCTCNGPIGPA